MTILDPLHQLIYGIQNFSIQIKDKFWVLNQRLNSHVHLLTLQLPSAIIATVGFCYSMKTSAHFHVEGVEFYESLHL